MLDGETPLPYRIRFSDTAAKQVEDFDVSSRERLDWKALELADLAAFAVGYSVSMPGLEALFADLEGMSIRYEVDNAAKTLTILSVAFES